MKCFANEARLNLALKSAPQGALAVLRSFPLTQASLAGVFGHKKTPSICLGLSGVGGPKRIRTAVAAFAELSLATRPSDPFQSGEHCGLANIRNGFH